MYRLSCCLAVGCLLIASGAARAGELQVTSDFEGGNGVVEQIVQEQSLIRIKPRTHAGRGWVCWWYVKVTGITPGQTLTLDVGGGRGVWVLPKFATFSTDGKTWRHTGEGQRNGKRRVYKQKIDTTEAWFAWGPPFTPRDAAALVERVARDKSFAQAFELCKTRGGRPVPALRIREGDRPATQRRGVWINARQHAWESGSSWVCRGLVEWLVSDDPRAAELRASADIYVVPIMDIDNTAVGAGGKEQTPHDHNRDWQDDAYFPAVRAATAIIKTMNVAGRFDLFLDLHNPGPGDLRPFYFVAPDDLLSERGKRNLKWFVQDAAAHITGPMKLADRTRTSGAGYDKLWKRISKNWVVMNTADHVVAVTLETSWNTEHSTPEGYMTVGKQQGLAIAAYLRRNTAEAVAE